MFGTIDFSYDPATGVRTATYRGAIDDACLLAAYRGLISNPDFVGLAHDQADLRAVTEVEFTGAGLRELGQLMSAPGLGPPPDDVPGLAIVATTPVAFGLARMYELMTEGRLAKQTRVFGDLDDATAWLRALPRLA